MFAIDQSDQFINPAGYAQDVALSVLVGRPLAIARTAASISTAGAVLPASQANTSTSSALRQAVTNNWYDYKQRQANTCAGLDQVLIPARLGDLADVDDGLVAFLPETDGQAPYSVVYSATAPGNGANGVVQPRPDTVRLTLNGPPQVFTAIVDPRAPVHVTTGVLPAATMRIPPDQYLRAAQQLAVTFIARPVLRGQPALRVPLPAVAGFTVVLGHARHGARPARAAVLPGRPGLWLQPAAPARGLARPDTEPGPDRRRPERRLT